MSEKKKKEQVMHWTEHLGELRRRIFLTAFIFVISFGFGFYYVKEIYFFMEKDVPFQLNVISPFEIIWIYIIIATVTALIITVPFFALQLWLFISPGLTSKERKISLLYIPAIFALFILGLAFGYFVVKDFILNFLLDLNDGLVNEMFTAANYFRFILQTTIPFAIFFEVPLISMFLTSLGILHPDYLKRIRKFAYLILVILGTMLSPPDFILQLFVVGPFIALYEIAILSSSVVHKRRLKKLNQVQKL